MRNTMRAFAMVAALLLAGALGVAAIAADGGPSSPSTVVTTPEPSSSVSIGDDVKGNCDEVEHADDPECRGSQEREDRHQDGIDDGDNDSGPSEDSGPGNVDDDDHGDDDHGDDDLS